MKGSRIALLCVLLGGPWTPTLSVTLVGNAGVMMSDGETSLLIDLPYQSGAFGYETYDWQALDPPGATVSVITHHHGDHFEPDLFAQRPSWRLIGPPGVSREVGSSRVLAGDSVQVGSFSVVAIATPHTDDHRSYRVRWLGRVFHVTGDTESADALRASPPVDVLFITPWLSCIADGGMGLGVARRRIVYHRSPSGSDEMCGDMETLPQGSTFMVTPAGSFGGAGPHGMVRQGEERRVVPLHASGRTRAPPLGAGRGPLAGRDERAARALRSAARIVRRD